MALQLTNTDTVFDNATLQLSSAQFATTAVVAGTTYLFVTGFGDDGLSVFSVAADGRLTNVHNVSDNATLALDSAWGVTTAVVAGTTYLFVAGFADDGVSVFSVAPNGTLTNVHNVSDNATLELFSAYGVATAVVAGTTYLFVTGFNDRGLSVFSVAPNGTLTNVANVTDNPTLELDGASGMATAVVGGTTYLFVTGAFDDGVSVFSVAANGALTNVANVTDDAVLQLDRVEAVTTAVVAGSTYLFAAGENDSGVSVFRVGLNGALVNVANVDDDATLELDGASHLTTAVIDGTTYLFVTGQVDDGISVFSVAANGALTNVINVGDNATLALNGASGVTTAVVSGTTHLFVAGRTESGVSVFSVADPPPVITSNGGGDTALVTVAENTTAVTTVVATDPGSPSAPVYSISGGADGSRFQISSATGILSFVAAPDFEAPTDADLNNSYLVQVRAFDGIRDDRQTITVNVTDVEEGSPSDTQLGDVLWRHPAGFLSTGTHLIAFVPVFGQVAGSDDFDGDGDSDILFRHDDDTVSIGDMEDGFLLGDRDLGIVGSTWQIAATGDFDDDDDADILWRHRDGQVVTWEMENGGYVVNHNLGVVGTNWHIAGTGDFDGDGDADILWRHADGQVVTWEMENGAFVVNHNLGIVGTTWRIAGTGDFDGDGDADILWRHRDGQVVTWEMENGALVVNHNLAVAADTWQIQGVHDFDSDGDADILWRHDGGGVVTWEIENGAYLQNHNFGVVSNAWQIRGTGEFDLA